MNVILRVEEKPYGIVEFFSYLKGHHLLATAMALVLSYKIVNVSEIIRHAISERDVSKLDRLKTEALEFIISVILIFFVFKMIGRVRADNE